MKDLSIEALMELLEHAGCAEFNNEFFGDTPKYSWSEVKEEVVRRLREV